MGAHFGHVKRNKNDTATKYFLFVILTLERQFFGKTFAVASL